jgi:tetraacyldisaccharide 4'-kinase
LSRGYKRDTTGHRIAGQEDTAKTIGDEPLQLFRKFGSRIHVAVGEDRVYAIPHILMEFPATRVLVLDDAMQQRSICPHLTILLTSFRRPFFDDFLLPFGRLREARSGAGRADAVVITKCPPDLSGEDQVRMKDKVQRYTGDKPVFFSTVAYGDPVPARPGYTMADTIILVTGIANADPLLEFCSARFRVVRHFRFADHHRYSPADMEEIERSCESFPETLSVLTTEKDMAKLDSPEYAQYLDRRPWFSMPIRQVFIQDGSKFDALVVDAVERAPQP